MSKRGFLIAFEGGEGSGKSTQVELLAETLRTRGHDVLTTREPGGTEIGKELRQLVMHRDPAPAPITELFIYLADRAEHVETCIKPALRDGKVVITDRFSGSTIAYQQFGRGLKPDMVRDLDAYSRNGTRPDLTLFLDLPAEEGLARARGSDRFHAEDIAFHRKVRDGFIDQYVRSKENALQQWSHIDATKSIEAVWFYCVAASILVIERTEPWTVEMERALKEGVTK